jgi:hypothetical protein
MIEKLDNFLLELDYKKLSFSQYLIIFKNIFLFDKICFSIVNEMWKEF